MLVQIKSMVEIENNCVCKNGILVDKVDSEISFLPHMKKYCGEKTRTIRKTERGVYLEIDAGKSLWPLYWLEIIEK